MHTPNVKGNKRPYKAGKTEVLIFQYSKEGKFLKIFKSQSEVFDLYYNGKKGRLFDENKQIKELPDDTVICKERLGRDSITLLNRIYNSKFCYKNTNERPFSIYNLLGEKIYSFTSIDAYCKLTGEKYQFIKQRLNSVGNSAHELRYKYDDNDTVVYSIIDNSKVFNVDLIDLDKLKNYLLKSYLVNEGGRLIEMALEDNLLQAI